MILAALFLCTLADSVIFNVIISQAPTTHPFHSHKLYIYSTPLYTYTCCIYSLWMVILTPKSNQVEAKNEQLKAQHSTARPYIYGKVVIILCHSQWWMANNLFKSTLWVNQLCYLNYTLCVRALSLSCFPFLYLFHKKFKHSLENEHENWWKRQR